jgi:hypothetical protein
MTAKLPAKTALFQQVVDMLWLMLSLFGSDETVAPSRGETVVLFPCAPVAPRRRAA